MQWSADACVGFTTADEPWLPVGDDARVRNVDTQLKDPDSHLHLYRRLLSFRRNSAALQTGSYQPVDPVPPECFVFKRSQGSERVHVAINFSAEPRSIDAAKGLTGRIALSTQRSNEGNEVNGVLDLLPNEAVVVV